MDDRNGTVPVWIGHCHVAGGLPRQEALLAVRCPDAGGFAAAAAAFLPPPGWRRVVPGPRASPAAAWRTTALAAEAAALEAALAGGPVSALRLLPPRTEETEPRAELRLRRVPGVVPLDAQIGVRPRATVPAALDEPLFGGGLATYAVIDAARVPLLIDLLAEEGRPHRSLFQGEAAEALQRVAPRVVALDRASDLTRRLFTDVAGIGLWAANAAVFLRSPLPLEELVRHLRKLYLVAAADGEPATYLRFWAPETLRVLVPVLRRSARQAAGFFGAAIAAVAWRQPGGGDVMVLGPQRPLAGPAGVRLEAGLDARLARGAAVQRAAGMLADATALIAARDPAAAAALRAIPPLRRLLHARRADAMGLRSADTFAALLSIIALTGMNVLQEPAFHYATRNPFLAPEAKARQLLLAYSMIAQPRGGV